MEFWVNGKVQDRVPSRGWALQQVIVTVCTTVHIQSWFSYATIFVFWDFAYFKLIVHEKWGHISTAYLQITYTEKEHMQPKFQFYTWLPMNKILFWDIWSICRRSTTNFSVQLQFSLYLCGDFNGTVHLSVVENGMSASPLIWERSGHWKDAWQEITLPITEILKGWDD